MNKQLFNDKKIIVVWLGLVLLILILWFFQSSKNEEVNTLGVSNQNAINSCKASTNQSGCWSDLIDGELKSKGLDKTFVLFGDLYSAEPAFAADCHSYAHQLGQAAYFEYAAGHAFSLTAKTSYCGYGFYHGFLETLLQKTGDPTKAVSFCNFVGEKLKGQTSDASGACFHGIGHGTVDGSDTRAWGNPQAIVKPGISVCEKIAAGDKQVYGPLYRCITGAYNALEILSANPKYQLSNFRADPFDFCAGQPAVYFEACYTNMLPALLSSTPDFNQVAKEIEGIKEGNTSAVREGVILSLFHEYYHFNINLNMQEFAQSGLAVCHSLEETFRLPCVEGLAGGLMKYGEPEKEYVKTLDFCTQSALSNEEENVCYRRTLSTLGVWYASSKVTSICSSVPQKYQEYCL